MFILIHKSGNYDTYVQTRRDQDMVQMRQYEAEQRDIAEIKDFIARFGHGTVKMVRQAQAREKLLQKKLEAGLTEKPESDPEWDWSFPDAGQLPVPVLSIENVSFGYPNSVELYSGVDFGVDLQVSFAQFLYFITMIHPLLLNILFAAYIYYQNLRLALPWLALMAQEKQHCSNS